MFQTTNQLKIGAKDQASESVKAGLVYHLSSLPVANGLNKPLYKSTNQWEKDIYDIIY